jgi:hypothetical protein
LLVACIPDFSREGVESADGLVDVSVTNVVLVVFGKVVGQRRCSPLGAEYATNRVVPANIELFVDSRRDGLLKEDG